MKTEVRKWESAEEVSCAASVLKRGGLVVFPTETVYGLGALLSSKKAVERIYSIKEREREKPLSILLSDAEQIAGVCKAGAFDQNVKALAAAFWPGPLTLVLPKSGRVPDHVTAGKPTVGIRIPDHAFARALIEAVGEPVVTTSANLSGKPAAVSAEEAAEALCGSVDLIIDGGPASVKLASTVLGFSEEGPVIFREGTISKEAVLHVIDKNRQQ